MTIQRGQIYVVNVNPVHGREQAGQRPVLVLSIAAINRLPLVVTVVCFRLRTLDPRRFPPSPAGNLSGRIVEQVEQAVRCCLGLSGRG